MTADQVIFNIILPSAITIGGVVYNSQRQKRMEFNYDYRKYILDKRKEAYTKVEAILNGFQNVHLPDGKVIQKFFDFTEDHKKEQTNPLTIFNDYVIVEATRSAMWMSTNMVAMLEYINFLLVNQIKQLKEKGMKHSDLIEIGVRDHMHLLYVHNVLFDIYIADLLHLDDIDEFKKMKQRETPKYTKQARQFIASEIQKKKTLS